MYERSSFSPPYQYSALSLFVILALRWVCSKLSLGSWPRLFWNPPIQPSQVLRTREPLASSPWSPDVSLCPFPHWPYFSLELQPSLREHTSSSHLGKALFSLRLTFSVISWISPISSSAGLRHYDLSFPFTQQPSLLEFLFRVTDSLLGLEIYGQVRWDSVSWEAHNPEGEQTHKPRPPTLNSTVTADTQMYTKNNWCFSSFYPEHQHHRSRSPSYHAQALQWRIHASM